ncbi:unnamed protein product [Protopolystoma xenopodis]|uniref:Uncharacterized protein n=1 Tax=Protopolystoma xenopodis TaxID=117903 RepID=A0A3S5CK71_9PLAT|nr:unnamed protein product [Protopolystoma xenopodis]
MAGPNPQQPSRDHPSLCSPGLFSLHSSKFSVLQNLNAQRLIGVLLNCCSKKARPRFFVHPSTPNRLGYL